VIKDENFDEKHTSAGLLSMVGVYRSGYIPYLSIVQANSGPNTNGSQVNFAAQFLSQTVLSIIF